MNKLKQQILELQHISSALEPPETQRNQYINHINNYTNSFINTLDDTNAYSKIKNR